MKKRTIAAFLVSISITLLSGCVPTISQLSTTAVPSAAPSSETARIVIINANMPGTVHALWFEEDTVLASVRDSSYTVFEVPAGKHMFVGALANGGSTPPTQAIMGTFEGGKTYYIRMRFFYGIKLQTTNKETGETLISSLEKTELKQPDADNWFKQNEDFLKQKLEQYKNGEGTPLIVDPEVGE